MVQLSASGIADAWERSIRLFGPGVATELLGKDVSPRLVGRLLVQAASTPAREERLDEVPSETTPAERRFLSSFFERWWDGESDVVEIGPFLGGSTRAIATGMMLNPARDPSKRLYTFDCFSDYYKPDALKATLEPLFQRGTLDRASLEDACAAGTFLEIFRGIHGAQDYGALIVAIQAQLAATPEEEARLQNPLRLPAELRPGAIFIDGCKSWYGTRIFMLEVSLRALPGAYVIFQDYLWHTCFWIPAFVAEMAEYFELVAYVDGTYAFQLQASLVPDEIERRFPACIDSNGRGHIDRIFDRLQQDASSRSDTFALFRHSLQHAAALAYLGDRDDARRRMLDLAANPGFAAYRESVEAALANPAYRPEGVIHF